MTELFSTAVTASILLFAGGALTALGVERLYWSAKSGVLKMLMKRRERVKIDA